MPMQFVPPVGLYFPEAPPDLEEGYEVQWRGDGDPPHHYFCVQMSALRVPRLLADAVRALPRVCQAVLEIRRDEATLDADPDGPERDRWVSEPIASGHVLAVLERYEFQILHDGRVGFGVFDPESALEVFLDDHKLVNLFAPDLDPFAPLLARYHVPHREHLETLLDLPHEHHTLMEVPDHCQVPQPRYLRHRRFDVDQFGPFIRDRLGMRPAPQWAEDELPGVEDTSES